MKRIKDFPLNTIKGGRFLVRADFNVPLGESGKVMDSDAERIIAGLETIKYLSFNGAKVVVISHLGKESDSLKPVADYINNTLDFKIGFIPSLVGDTVHDIVTSIPDGGAVLLENLRQHPGEKANDWSFAEELSTYADFYVNDAFSVSHRAHASVVSLPKILPAYAGELFWFEFENLTALLDQKTKTALLLGGAKFGTKLKLVNSFLPKAETVFIGGALANRFFQLKGWPVGKSLVDETADVTALLDSEKVILPKDVLVVSPTGESRLVEVGVGSINENECIVDVGPNTVSQVLARIKECESVIWNGPLGNYEAGFIEATRELALGLSNKKFSVALGGGDTVAFLKKHNLLAGYDFVSMAGGAMLDFLADGGLVGLDALNGKYD